MSQPVQYRDGSVEFFGLNFLTDSRALIPRFETEFLVKRAIQHCQKDPSRTWKILDIGTGSGIIPVSLAKNLSNAQITALDISPEALDLAKENAAKHGVNVKFIHSDLLTNYTQSADIILANLPYIPSQRISQLDASVKEYEPHLALDGGPDGLDLYRRLFNQIAAQETKPELCVFELDDDQAQLASQEASQLFPEAKIEIVRDTSDFMRYIVLEFK